MTHPMGIDPTPILVPKVAPDELRESLAAAAHVQAVTHHYRLHYPAHGDRASDPYYHLFDAVKARYKATAFCWYAHKIADATRCSGGLELHHWVLEQAVINEVDLKLLNLDFPAAGASVDDVDKWVESTYAEDGSGALVFLCVNHHRTVAGVHAVDFASWKASWYAPAVLDGPSGASGV